MGVVDSNKCHGDPGSEIFARDVQFVTFLMRALGLNLGN